MPKTKLDLKTTAIMLIIGFVSLAASIGLSSVLENKRSDLRPVEEQEELYLQGEKLRGFVFGSEGLIADWYWMRSLQYIGEKLYKAKVGTVSIDNLKPLNPKLLYPLLDSAASMDPHFMAVYSYGATVLPAIDPKQAIAIVEKGIAANPDEWMLYHQLGYIYWKLEDYKKASVAYTKGSSIKGAPGWMTSMAGRMNAEGGSRETARAIYTQLFETAGDDQTRESAKHRLAALDSFDERKILDEALGEYKKVQGRCAQNWQQMVSILTRKRLPGGRDFRIDSDGNVVDPTDAPYLIDSAACTAKPDFTKSKLPQDE